MTNIIEAKTGDWIVFRAGSVYVRQAEKVTAKIIKFAGRYWPRQVRREDKVYAALADKDAADRLKQSIDGVLGEFSRKRAAADRDYNARVNAAQEAADKQILALVQQVQP